MFIYTIEWGGSWVMQCAAVTALSWSCCCVSKECQILVCDIPWFAT